VKLKNYFVGFIILSLAVSVAGAEGDILLITDEGDILHQPMQVEQVELNGTNLENDSIINETIEETIKEEPQSKKALKIKLKNQPKPTPKKLDFTSPLVTSPTSEETNNKTSVYLSFSKSTIPPGYPPTANSVLFAFQNLTVSATLRNLANTSVTVNFKVEIRNVSNDARIDNVVSGATVLSAAGGSTESKTLENVTGSPVTWNTGSNRGDFYVWMNVTPQGSASFTVDTKANPFRVGTTTKANFSSCTTDNSEYYPGDVVSLSENCTIINTGNTEIIGYVVIQVHKYDEQHHEWNRGVSWPIDLITPVALTVGVSQSYGVVGQVGAVTWNVTNETDAATYRMMVAITDSFGTVLNQYIGSNIIDTMENSLPGIMVEKFINPTLFESGGNQSTNVTIRVRHSGHSLRDAGLFATGSEAQDFKTPLDITFVIDTSGSMGDDWEDLTEVMQNIINSLSVDANINHDIFALYGHYGSHTTYVINGVVYPIKVLNYEYMNGTQVFSDDFEGTVKWNFVNNFSITEDDYLSSSHSACSIYSPEASRIFEDDVEGSLLWELRRWNVSENDSNSSAHSFYTSLIDPITHLDDDAESGAGQWNLEQFSITDLHYLSASSSFYCGYGSGGETYFEDDAEDGSGRWDLQKFEISGADFHSANNSYFCNYTPAKNLFFDDVEGSLKWNLNCFHFNYSAYNSSNKSFHSTYTTGVVLFFDDFENGTDNWNLSNWTRTNITSYSANHSVLAHNMSNTVDTQANMTLVNAIDLTGVSNARLTFQVNSSGTYPVFLYVSINGGANWTLLEDIYESNIIADDTYGDWVEHVYDLTPYIGNHVLLKFVYDNLYFNSYYYEYFFLDDVLVDTFKLANYLTLLEPLNYTNNTYPTLYFMLKENTTSSSRLYLEASEDGTSWSTVTSWYGTDDWEQKTVDLSSRMDYPYLRFRVSFTAANQYVFLDDIHINYSAPCIMRLTNPAEMNYTGKGDVKINMSVKENGTGYVRLQGSNDGVSWTNIASYYTSYYQWYNKSTTLPISYQYKYLRIWYLPEGMHMHAFIDDVSVTHIPECVMTLASPLDLTDTTGRTLDFYVKHNNTYSNYLIVEYSTDGSDWNTFGTVYGTDTNWTKKTYSPETSVQYIRFRFTPLAQGQYIYLDDILLWSKRTNNLTLSTPVDTTDLTKLRLLLSAKYNTTADVTIQYKYLDASSGIYSTWRDVGSFSGESTGWTGHGFDLTDKLTTFYNQLVLHFVITPNSISDWVYIDDIFIEATTRNNMTLITAIDLTNAETNVILKFATMYNTQGKTTVQVSTNGGTSWSTLFTYNGSTSTRWENMDQLLNTYVGDNILLRFSHIPLWTSDYVCIDDIEVLEDVVQMNFDSEDWGPGTEYLSEEYPWRPEAVKVIFPISDECPEAGNPGGCYEDACPCDARDVQSILDAIEACQNVSASVYPIHGTWYETRYAVSITSLMSQLASACGGSTSSAGNTTELEEAIIASLSSELKIAGNNIQVFDAIVNDSFVVPDWSSFKADGSSVTVPESKKQRIGNTTINTTFDRSYIGALNRITSDPPEEVEITYTVNLINLFGGDKKDVNLGGSLIYEEPLKAQSRSGVFSGGFIEVKPGADLLIFLDDVRLRDLGYNTTHIQELISALQTYATANNGTIYNLSVYRNSWEGTNGQNAFQGTYNPTASSSMTNAGKSVWQNRYSLDFKTLVHSLVLQGSVEYVLFVGHDNVIPFQRIESARPGREDSYTFIPGNILWSDLPYADINSDFWPDVAVSRLIGSPQVMKTTVEATATQYVKNSTLVAAMELGIADAKTIADILRNTWGFGGNTFTYYEESGTENLVDWNVSNKSFLDRLDDGHALVYVCAHGNDFREGVGNAIQRYSDHTHKCNNAGASVSCCCRINPGGPPAPCWWPANCADKADLASAFEPYKLFFDTSQVPNITGNPFYINSACHGGVTYPDDTETTNMPLAFLSKGAVGFVGSAVYEPTSDRDFFIPFFNKMKTKTPAAKAMMLAKRDNLASNNDERHKSVNQGIKLFGIPTYVVYVPNDPPGPLGYNLSVNSSGNTTSLNVYVDALNWSNVSIPVAGNDTGDNETLISMENASTVNRTIIAIDGADMHHRDGEPIVPVIVETVTLPSTVNVSEVLNATTMQLEVYYGVQLALKNDSSKTFSDSPYSAADLGWGHIYPNETIDWEVIEETSGNQTLVLRIYPVRYNESNRTVYVYRNITFGYVEQEVPVQLADLEVTTELTASQIIVTLRNKGSVDIENVVVVANLPENITASGVSDGGAYYPVNNTIEWTITSIPTGGISSIQTRTANLGIPAAGDYTINATVTYYGQGSGITITEQDTKTQSFEVTSLLSTNELIVGWNLISMSLNIA